jgi:hypothetical protein
LIKRWESSIRNQDEDDLKSHVRRRDEAARTINTIIGKNYVPAHPLFILTILQTIESGNSATLKDSAYGHYYHFLITQAFVRLGIQHAEMDAYFTYITDLSHFMFSKDKKTLTEYDLREFHTQYFNTYKNILDYEKTILVLSKASIFEKTGIGFRFQYKYTYYYFVGLYLSNNISKPETRSIISKMCQDAYRDEYSNIILFLTHHSKDPFILEEILKNSRKCFAGLPVLKLETDITVVNDLLTGIPNLIYKSKNIDVTRKKVLQKLDADEAKKNNDNDDMDSAPKDPSSAHIQWDLSYKNVELVGQILKNYYGSLHGDVKLDLVQENYSTGLRGLANFYGHLAIKFEYLIGQIRANLEAKNYSDKSQIEKISKNVIFNFFVHVSMGFIHRISECTGSEKLHETYKEVLQKNDFASFHLIDTSIKLNFYKSFPWHEIENVKKRFGDNLLVYSILRRLVVNYLYMYPTTYKEKQKICSLLGIPMDVQRNIDRDSPHR